MKNSIANDPHGTSTMRDRHFEHTEGVFRVSHSSMRKVSSESLIVV